MTERFKHQIAALDKMRGKKVFALFMEMGTAKSRVIIDEFAEFVRKYGLFDLLVIAPAGSYRNWADEFKKWFPSDLEYRLAVWKSGSANNEVKTLLQWTYSSRVLLMNIEAMSTVKAAREACKAILVPRRAGMVIDESTTLRDPRSKRTLAVTNIGVMAVYRRILSGLPTPKSPFDFYGQLRFLDPSILGFDNFTTFKAHHAKLRLLTDMDGNVKRTKYGKVIPIVDKDREGKPIYLNIEELQDKIAPHQFRVLKSECLDLPPKVYEFRDVEMTAEQKRIYKELRDRATVELESGDHVTATVVIAKMVKLHQVLCGHIKDETGGFHLIPSKRNNALLEVLEEHDGKAIIWANYDHNIRDIAVAVTEEYGEGSCAMFWGGNRTSRHLDEERWKTDPQCRFMISTQAAGGRGNNWTEANLVIYFSNNYDLEHREQSEDRSHRQGQVNKVTYIDLICRGTVDEIIINSLRHKIDLAQRVMGEGDWRRYLV